MDIKLLLSSIQNTSLSFDVTGLSLNSSTLQKGDLFIALQGEQKHGSEFINHAIDNGCIGVLVDGKDIECSVPSIRIDNLRSYLQNLLKTYIQKQRILNLLQ